MTESILSSVKEKVGVDPTCTDFDSILIDDINTAFMVLYQLGVGPKTPFKIISSTETWSDFLGDETALDGVKRYVADKVSMLFDPPQMNSIGEVKKANIAEMEWRLNAEADYRD